MTDKELEICRRGLRAVACHYGLLVAKRIDRAVVSAATATFVRIDGRPFVITADHVVGGLTDRGEVWLQIVAEDSAGSVEVPRLPIELKIALDGCLSLRMEREVDIAVIPAPSELCSLPHVGWFDADLQIDIVAQLRCHVSEGQPQRLACMVLGYPISSRFFNLDFRLQVFGSFPLWGAIESFHYPPLSGGYAPQVVVEVEVPRSEELSSDVHEIARMSVENFCNMENASVESENEPSPLGGYSGGPLMYFCESGNYLVGILKEGGVRLGGVTYAVPIDAIVERIRASNLAK